MRSAVGMLCAALLLAGAGCTWDTGSTRVEADVQINDQAIDATLDEAAAKVQRELQRLNLEVKVVRDADAVRVVSRTKTGDQFTVVLSRSHTASGQEQTKVRIDWGAGRDRELEVGLLLALGISAQAR